MPYKFSKQKFIKPNFHCKKYIENPTHLFFRKWLYFHNLVKFLSCCKLAYFRVYQTNRHIKKIIMTILKWLEVSYPSPPLPHTHNGLHNTAVNFNYCFLNLFSKKVIPDQMKFGEICSSSGCIWIADFFQRHKT